MQDESDGFAGRFGRRAPPMVHGADMAAGLAVCEALGGRLVLVSRDADGALARLERALLSLLACATRLRLREQPMWLVPETTLRGA